MVQPSDVTALLDVERLLAELDGLSPSAVRRQLFEALSGVAYSDLDAVWLGRKELAADASASLLLSNLALLLDLRKKDAAAVLGVSESRVSRNDRVDVPMLDRAQGVSEVFADVAAVLGPQGTRAWLKTPNPGLNGEPPFKLLGTGYGERRVRNLLTALLNGAVV